MPNYKKPTKKVYARKPRRRVYANADNSTKVPVLSKKPTRKYQGLFKDAGNFIGGLWSPSLGNAMGTAGDWLGKITGFGDYKTMINPKIAQSLQSNSLLDIGKTDPPQFVATPSAGVRVRHREYIQDVISNTALYSAQIQLNINPGLFNSFPWLSGVANNFQQYKIHGLIFEFVTTSGNSVASTNTSLGEVMMGIAYNAGNAIYTTKQQMLNDEFAVSIIPSCNGICAAECDPRQTTIDKLYVRSGAVPAGEDIRLYDLGLFQLAVGGNPASNNVLGELYMSYDIEFFKTTLPTSDYSVASHLHLTGVSSSAFLGTAFTSNLNTMVLSVTGTGTVLNIAAGNVGAFMLIWDGFGNSGATQAYPTYTFTNLTNPNTFFNNALAVTSSAAQTAAQGQWISYFVIQNSALPSTITFSSWTPMTSPNNGGCDLFCIQVPVGLNL